MDVSALVKPFLSPADPPVNLVEALELGLFGSQVRVFHMCGQGVAQNVWDEVWSVRSVKTLPTSAAVASATSTASVDNSTGAGARELEITGWGSSWDLVTETISLNGVTSVATSASFFRIIRARVVSTGATGANSGTITVRIGGINQGEVLAGDNVTLLPQFTVPSGHVGLVYDWEASAEAAGSDGGGGVRFYLRPSGEVYYPRVERRLSLGYQVPRSGPVLVADALTDLSVRMYGIAVSGSPTVTTSYKVALFPSA